MVLRCDTYYPLSSDDPVHNCTEESSDDPETDEDYSGHQLEREGGGGGEERRRRGGGGGGEVERREERRRGGEERGEEEEEEVRRGEERQDILVNILSVIPDDSRSTDTRTRRRSWLVDSLALPLTVISPSKEYLIY